MKILYLAHRIPYPPNKGDKIRSFHEIKHFSRHHELHLLSFYDDPKEVIHAENLKKFCKMVTLIPLRRRRQQARAIIAMLSRKPWTLGYFTNPEMWAAVREQLCSSNFDAIFVYSSSMAPYVSSENGIPKFLDFVDSDGSKWLQYARSKSIPASWLYSYEGSKLIRFEQEMARLFDASIFVSSREAAHLTGEEYHGKIHFIQNGIDLDHFTCTRTGEPSKTMIFTGAMDYFPNIDAVSFFAREVFPLVKRRVPDARFMIVGSSPAGSVKALESIAGVTVTGSVPDIRPYLRDARVAVVPLRISQGIQNKILEALAAGLPVVTTPNAAGGLQAVQELPVTVLEDPGAFADQVVRHLLDSTDTSNRFAQTREVLAKHYDWSANLARLEALFPQLNDGLKRNFPLPPSKRENCRRSS